MKKMHSPCDSILALIKNKFAELLIAPLRSQRGDALQTALITGAAAVIVIGAIAIAISHSVYGMESVFPQEAVDASTQRALGRLHVATTYDQNAINGLQPTATWTVNVPNSRTGAATIAATVKMDVTAQTALAKVTAPNAATSKMSIGVALEAPPPGSTIQN